MHNIKHQTERLTLRFISMEDLQVVHDMNSLEEVERYNTLGIPANIEVTKSHIEMWLEEQKKYVVQKYVFAIELKDTNEFIGMIGMTKGKEKYKNAEVWFKFYPNYWNKGYGTEALKRIIRFGFQDLNLHLIEAGCAVGNIGSQKVIEKSGMIKEAHTRQLLPLMSGWSDNYGYAILSTDEY